MRLIQSLLFVAIAGSLATASAQTPEPVRLGIIFPLTGGSADMGNSALVGAQVAVEEINQVGGYLGRPLELVVRDDRADNDTGLKHTQELVNKVHVTATIGFCNTGVAMRSLDVFQNAKQILIVPCATGTVLTHKYPAAQSFIYRTSPPDSLQTTFLANEIKKRGLKRVGLLVDRTGYGDTGLQDLQSALAKVSVDVVKVIRFNIGVKSLESELQELKQAGADSVIGWTVGPEQGVLSASRAAIGWKVPQFGPWGLGNASAYQTSQGRVEGTLMVQTILPNIYLERNSTFLRHYSKFGKETPIGSMMSAAQTYDSVYLLLYAMFHANGDLSGPALKRALEDQREVYRGVVSTYDRPFSGQDHDAISANMLWLGTWRNGDRAYFYKEDEHLATMIRRKESGK
ncbi:ABC transporter substrate-binding protein [Ramlibacter sp. MMS24-I3-19]|uniref:ABC transporter substrate-binding protein n=1 Tax=Ramlibacter sp. MMS24-I3-19 TaxID=3416606 RepID=UPI003CFE47B6